jgi:hypothetical protein
VGEGSILYCCAIQRLQLRLATPGAGRSVARGGEGARRGLGSARLSLTRVKHCLLLLRNHVSMFLRFNSSRMKQIRHIIYSLYISLLFRNQSSFTAWFRDFPLSSTSTKELRLSSYSLFIIDTCFELEWEVPSANIPRYNIMQRLTFLAQTLLNSTEICIARHQQIIEKDGSHLVTHVMDFCILGSVHLCVITLIHRHIRGNMQYPLTSFCFIIYVLCHLWVMGQYYFAHKTVYSRRRFISVN